LKNWSSSNCSLDFTHDISDGFAHCLCNHLTDFSVNFNPESAIVSTLDNSNLGYLANGVNAANLGIIYEYDLFYVLIANCAFCILMSLWGR